MKSTLPRVANGIGDVIIAFYLLNRSVEAISDLVLLRFARATFLFFLLYFR
jgi:hypothetical protein